MPPDNSSSQSMVSKSPVTQTKRVRSPQGLGQLQQRLEDAELLLEVSRRMASFDQLDDVLRACGNDYSRHWN